MKKFIKSLFDNFNFGSGNSSNFSYPKNIGEYIFMRVFTEKDEHRSFKYAIYKHKGKKAFAKIWQGENKNYDYYSLLNEIENYKLVSKIYRQMDISKTEFSDIKIPEVKKYVIKNNLLILMCEFIDGKIISNLSNREKVKIYDHLMMFFEYIGKDLRQRKKINSKYYLLFPIYLLIALIKNPDKAASLLGTFPIFIMNLKNVIFSNSYSFVHRSLEDHNIIKKDGSIYPIDFQLATIGHPFLEIAQTLIFSWENKEFINEYMKTDRFRKILINENSRGMLFVILIYTALQQVVFENEDMKSCFSFIKYFSKLGYE